MRYREQLLAALIADGWELTRTQVQHLDWWCDEYWVVRSVRESRGMKVFIFFLVDPQWEGPRKAGQGVCDIAATTDMPRDWIEAGCGVATLQMWKGRWDLKLATFIGELDAHRRLATGPRESPQGGAMAPN